MVKTPNVSPTTSPLGPPSAKRKKVEEEDSFRLVAKKQRTRVRYSAPPLYERLTDQLKLDRSFSCGECHRRKQKV